MKPRPNVVSFGRRSSQPARGGLQLKRVGRTAAAFTLIELLLVIGLIVTLVAGFGLSLADQRGSSLAAAQQSVAAACGAARAQAALHQTESRVLVYGHRPPDGDAQKYFRLLQVFCADSSSSNRWVAAGAPIYLPRGIYVVPDTADTLLAPGVDWTTAPLVSSKLMATDGPEVPAGTEFADAATVYFVEFSPDGTASAGEEPVRLVLASAQPTETGPQFTTPGAMRAVAIRANGAIAFVNDGRGF